MSVHISSDLQTQLDSAEYIWFTTVRDDGQPQPTPVWFIQENDTFLIYSMPSAQKVRNIRTNPKVSLNYNPESDGENFIVIMGDAVIDDDAPSPIHNAAYFKKYERGIETIGMTPDSFEQSYSLAIRVTPTRVRGNSGE